MFGSSWGLIFNESRYVGGRSRIYHDVLRQFVFPKCGWKLVRCCNCAPILGLVRDRRNRVLIIIVNAFVVNINRDRAPVVLFRKHTKQQDLLIAFESKGALWRRLIILK